MITSFAKRWSGFTLFLATLLVVLGMPVAHADVVYDPYADSVVATAGCSNVGNPQNAVGAPDGSYYTVVGVDNSITFNMGEFESGTGDLDVRIGPLTVAANMSVEFLNSDFELIDEETEALAISLLTPVTYTIEYDWTENDNQAYRYVRISTLSALGFGIDAITADAYVGSDEEIDTDEDTYPDRDEIDNGTDPLNPNDPGDVTSPEITITSHTQNQTVSGTITITAVATDNIAIDYVQFYVNDSPVGSPDTTSPYQYVWDTTSVANGNNLIRAATYDTSANSAVTDYMTLNVNN
jgi:hypothetical protein